MVIRSPHTIQKQELFHASVMRTDIDKISGRRGFILQGAELQLQRRQAQVRHERCFQCQRQLWFGVGVRVEASLYKKQEESLIESGSSYGQVIDTSIIISEVSNESIHPTCVRFHLPFLVRWCIF